MTTTFKSVPLVAPGHTRPVTHLSFSPLQDDKSYLLISSCKDGNPMLREWTGDWIGTFIGHKGAVWSSKISRDTSKAVSGSADFTAYVSPTLFLSKFPNFLIQSRCQQDLGYLHRTVSPLLPPQSYRSNRCPIFDLLSSPYRWPREKGQNF
jgi:WD40 repeat protein